MIILAELKVEHPIALVLAIVITIVFLGIIYAAGSNADPNNIDLGFGCIAVFLFAAWVVSMCLIFNYVHI